MTDMPNWPTLLQRLSKKLFSIADEYELEGLGEDEPARIKSKWLGEPPATEDAIAAREAALGVKLPADYRAFLLASNGFKGLAGLPHGLCSLLPVEEIGWMRDNDRVGRLEEYLKERAAGAELPEEFMVDVDDYARTILIGESDGNECILLLPPKGDGEWALWTYDPECGFETDCTFTELMESALEV
jgi:cell wall assembly regulator SMI1